MESISVHDSEMNFKFENEFSLITYNKTNISSPYSKTFHPSTEGFKFRNTDKETTELEHFRSSFPSGLNISSPRSFSIKWTPFITVDSLRFFPDLTPRKSLPLWVNRRLSKLKNLKKDWDGYDALPTDRDALKRTKVILYSVLTYGNPKIIEYCNINPSPDSRTLLEWSINHNSYRILIPKNGTIKAYMRLASNSKRYKILFTNSDENLFFEKIINHMNSFEIFEAEFLK